MKKKDLRAAAPRLKASISFTMDELSTLAGWLEGQIDNMREDNPGEHVGKEFLSAYEKINTAWSAAVSRGRGPDARSAP